MLEVKVHDLKLKNPVLTASGTFGYGEEFADFIDLNRLGGFVVKGTTGSHREGNPYPRMVETPSGMLNSVGLQNGGVEKFCTEAYHRIKHLDTNIIVNVSGSSIEEYCSVAEQIDELEQVPTLHRSSRQVFQGQFLRFPLRTKLSCHNLHVLYLRTPECLP